MNLKVGDLVTLADPFIGPRYFLEVEWPRRITMIIYTGNGTPQGVKIEGRPDSMLYLDEVVLVKKQRKITTRYLRGL